MTSADDILLLDVDVVEDRESAVEMACLANCYVYQRFFSRPAPLLHRHPVFTALHRCIGALPVYFGRAQAAGKATGIIDPLVAEWTYPMELITLLFQGKISSVFERLFNGSGGALALYNLTATEPFLECPSSQLYVVEAVLKLMIAFAKPTFVAAGWVEIGRAHV